VLPKYTKAKRTTVARSQSIVLNLPKHLKFKTMASTYKNSDVLAYISEKGLVTPESYGISQSNGTAVDDIDYLLWLRHNFPDDLKKVFGTYPLAERILYEHDYKENKTERDPQHQEE